MPDELEVEAQPPRLHRPPPSNLPVVLAVVLVCLGVAGWWAYSRSRRLASASTAAEATAPLPAPAGTSTAAAPAPATSSPPPVDLPALDASDGFVRERLRELSGDPRWASWLAGDGLARRFAAAVSAVSRGASPRRVLDQQPVRGAFSVRTAGERTLIDAASFARYDGIADTLATVDAAKARPLWRLVHPLVDAAWSEIEPPARELDGALLAAVDHLLATPLPAEEIAVLPAAGFYRYADPTLESLSPAQKHLLRMGPRNAAKVRQALLELRRLLAE